MSLFRLHAYSVTPQRTATADTDPEGGAVEINASLRQVLEESIQAADFQRRTPVDFAFDGNDRSNAIRDYLLTYAFQNSAQSEEVARNLAELLSQAMDRRSTPCLFILAAKRYDDKREVTIWTFPKDQAFQLRTNRARVAINVLTDVFSQTSKLRKAAFFHGRNIRTEFLGGRVLDFQANNAAKEVADFWIGRFLQCELGMRGESGTRLLAKTIRAAFDACQGDTAAQEQLYTGTVAIRGSQRRRWTLRKFAHEYLDGNARQAFLNAAPNPDSVNATFDFQKEQFESALQFRIFRLESGVYVSTPFDQIGYAVKVSADEQRRLSCEGIIVEEKMRTRHA